MIFHYRSTKISKHGFNFPCQFNCQEMSCIKISTIMATINVLLHSGDWQQQTLPEDITFIHATSHNYVIYSDIPLLRISLHYTFFLSFLKISTTLCLYPFSEYSVPQAQISCKSYYSSTMWHTLKLLHCTHALFKYFHPLLIMPSLL